MVQPQYSDAECTDADEDWLKFADWASRDAWSGELDEDMYNEMLRFCGEPSQDYLYWVWTEQAEVAYLVAADIDYGSAGLQSAVQDAVGDMSEAIVEGMQKDFARWMASGHGDCANLDYYDDFMGDGLDFFLPFMLMVDEYDGEAINMIAAAVEGPETLQDRARNIAGMHFVEAMGLQEEDYMNFECDWEVLDAQCDGQDDWMDFSYWVTDYDEFGVCFLMQFCGDVANDFMWQVYEEENLLYRMVEAAVNGDEQLNGFVQGQAFEMRDAFHAVDFGAEFDY